MAEGCEVLPPEGPGGHQTGENGKVTGLVVQPQVIGEVRGGRPAPGMPTSPRRSSPATWGSWRWGGRGGPKRAPPGQQGGRGNIIGGGRGSVPGTRGGVFSGGDCVSGPATVILAVAAGKVAAASIRRVPGLPHGHLRQPGDSPRPLPPQARHRPGGPHRAGGQLAEE